MIKRMTGTLLLASLLMLMSACVQESDVKSGNFNWLSAKQIETLFVKKTAVSRNASGTISNSYYHSKGKVSQYRNGKIRTGRWEIKDKGKDGGRICLQMEGKTSSCRAIAKIDGQYYKYVVKKSGRHERVVTYLKFMKGKKLMNSNSMYYRH